MFDFAKLAREATPKQLFRFPTLEDRTTINGRTGSGKTVAGAWLLSESRFDLQPFVILDFKREQIFQKIKRRIEIGLDDMPVKPGVYHLTLLPHQVDEIESWLWDVWERGNIGLFVDEGHLIDRNSKAMKAIMVTGRAKKIPVYTLSQRPVSLPRHIFSEQNFYMSFHLNDKRDRETVAEWTPDDSTVWDMDVRLPTYHSRWYDVGEDFSCLMGPVPNIPRILQRFDDRLKPRKHVI